MRSVSLWSILAAFIVGCSGTGGNFVLDSGGDFGSLRSRGERVLGMDFADQPEAGTTAESFAFAKGARVGAMVLHLNWNQIESAPMTFSDPGGVLASLNSLLPANGFRLSLGLYAVDGATLVVPGDLRSTRFSDPAFIARYNALVAYVLGVIPDVELVYLGLGREADRYNAPSATFWADFGPLLDSVKNATRAARAGLKLGVSATYDGLVNSKTSETAALNDRTDVVAFTYFPLNADFTVKLPLTAGKEIPVLLSLYPLRLMALTETGYPSGGLNSSDEAKQSIFVRELFRLWDTEAERWIFTNFSRLHDWSANRAYAEAAMPPYSTGDERVVEFLRTMGFRTYPRAGQDKPAMLILRTEASKRDF